MKKFLFITLFMSVLALFNANAKVYTVESLPVVTKGTTKFVCNPDGILSAATVSSICSKMQKLEDSTSIQVLVVAVDSISPESDYDFAEEVGNHYGVGVKKYNSGLVILLVRSMRAIRFVTGEGLEGDLPDAICKRIQYQRMVPYLKDNRWDEGMLAGVDAVYGQLSGTQSFAPMEEQVEDLELTLTDWIIIILIFGLPLALIIYVVYRSGRCPYCKAKLKSVGQNSYRSGYKETILRNYLCTQCGRTTTRKSIIDHSPRSSGGGGGFSGGGSFGGGGTSFGGGSFGGGGAGSRF